MIVNKLSPVPVVKLKWYAEWAASNINFLYSDTEMVSFIVITSSYFHEGNIFICDCVLCLTSIHLSELLACGKIIHGNQVMTAFERRSGDNYRKLIDVVQCVEGDYNMMPPFFPSNQYSAHEKQFKVWIESNHSLRCHVNTLSWRQVSQSLPSLVTKMRVPVFCCFFFAGDWACEIELRQTIVICYPWRQRSWSCGVFTSWISDAHSPFQWKWQVLRNYDISVLQQVGMFFDGIACFMKV